WLEENTIDEEVQQVVLHEFGHVLGMIHEFQNPNAHIPWDWEKMYAFYEGAPNFWTKEVVKSVFEATSAEWLPGDRDFDPDSIMMFSIPAALTKNGVGYRQGTGLSESDKLFAAALYPPDGTKLDTAAPRDAAPTLPIAPIRPPPRPPSPPTAPTVS